MNEEKIVIKSRSLPPSIRASYLEKTIKNDESVINQ